MAARLSALRAGRSLIAGRFLVLISVLFVAEYGLAVTETNPSDQNELLSFTSL
jgi:hypothetical protein